MGSNFAYFTCLKLLKSIFWVKCNNNPKSIQKHEILAFEKKIPKGLWYRFLESVPDFYIPSHEILLHLKMKEMIYFIYQLNVQIIDYVDVDQDGGVGISLNFIFQPVWRLNWDQKKM